MPATSFWQARNSLTQRGIGPESVATAELDVSGLEEGDIAGLALLNLPYAWIGVSKHEGGNLLRFYNQQTSEAVSRDLKSNTVYLRAYCNFETDTGYLSYSTDGKDFTDISGPVRMPYQLRTFQGVRYALFNYNELDEMGGYADFNNFKVDEPRCKSLSRPIPLDQVITLRSLADSSMLVTWRNHLRPVAAGSPFTEDNNTHFRVLDRGKGRVALQSVPTGRFITVKGNAGLAEVRFEEEDQGAASTFQWQDMLRGDLMLMSLYNHRYIFADPMAGSLCSADARGARPDRKGGACFAWELVAK